MKYAICVATPFQLLNALNLVTNFLDESDEKDLFFRNMSSEMNEYLKKVNRLFDHIYEYDLKKKRNLLDDFIQARFPALYLLNLINPKIEIRNIQYDYITVTSGTELECALTRVDKNAKTIAYDDGLGSYVGDMIHDKKMHFLWRMCGRSNKRIKPEVLYINNKDFCQSLIATDYKQLKKMDEIDQKYNRMIFDIFNLSISNLYDTHKICYLTQPLEGLFDNTEFKNNIENILLEFQDDCFVRLHPRDFFGGKIKEKLSIDDSTGLWELICLNSITEEHILISGVSTAQLIPKLFYNIEPWLIFTYKLYKFDKRFESDYFSSELLVEKIRKEYKCKYKIMVPETLNELRENITVALRSGGIYE